MRSTPRPTATDSPALLLLCSKALHQLPQPAQRCTERARLQALRRGLEAAWLALDVATAPPESSPPVLAGLEAANDWSAALVVALRTLPVIEPLEPDAWRELRHGRQQGVLDPEIDAATLAQVAGSLNAEPLAAALQDALDDLGLARLGAWMSAAQAQRLCSVLAVLVWGALRASGDVTAVPASTLTRDLPAPVCDALLELATIVVRARRASDVVAAGTDAPIKTLGPARPRRRLGGFGRRGGARRSHARPLGLRLIVTYKFVKAPLMLALATMLTFWPKLVASDVRALIAEASEWGDVATRVAGWLELHLTPSAESKAAWLVWLDGISTALEGVLLASGKPWGEWVVVFSAATLIPFEVASLLKHASITRGSILVVNVVVVVYLARRRLRRDAERRGPRAQRCREHPVDERLGRDR